MRKQNNSGYSNTVADGVDLYLAKLHEDIQTLFNNLRRVIKSAAFMVHQQMTEIFNSSLLKSKLKE